MRISVVLGFLAMLAGAPPHAPASAGDPSPTPAPIVTGTRPACREIEGIAPLLGPGRVLLLGEIHGAVEPPAFARDVVCAALERGLDVTVELEIPISEDARAQSFLSSGGTPEEVRALLAGDFWQAGYQDGRPSRARLDLLEALRGLRSVGSRVKVVLIDPGIPTAAERDRGMAERLGVAVEASPAGFHVALIGNLHTSLDIGTPWDARYENAAYLFARAHPGVKAIALDVARTGGMAWTCGDAVAANCRAREVKGDPSAGTWNVRMNADGRRRGHDGVYGVGALTASPPARDAAEPPTK
jgi:hypothetical protein